jgi:uncharacterized protein with HEPN domain
MQREAKKYLFDIKESIDSIEQFFGNRYDFNLYLKNRLLRRGVERELGIIGEAMSRLLKLDNDIEISYPRRIIDLRNWVIHGYDKVDDVIVWGILIKDIPILKTEIESLISNSNSSNT